MDDHQHQLVLHADTDLQGMCLLLDTAAASGNAMLCVLIRSLLQANYKVVLCAVTQQHTHYHTILRKMGISNTVIDQRLVVHSVTTTPDEHGTTLRTLSESLVHDCTMPASDNPPAGVALVFDDASVLRVLYALDNTPAQWLSFLHACHAGVSRCAPKAHSMILVAHDDVSADRQWITHMQHKAQMVISLQAFPEGGEVLGRTAQVQLTRRCAQVPASSHTQSSGSSPMWLVRRCGLRVTDVLCRLELLGSG